MNVNKTRNDLGSKKIYKPFISIDVIMYVTDHLKGSIVFLK